MLGFAASSTTNLKFKLIILLVDYILNFLEDNFIKLKYLSNCSSQMIKESQEVINKAVQFFSSLSDKTRLTILMSLVDGSKTVTEIYSLVGNHISLSAISHQLASLHDQSIVKFEKNGREKHYALSDELCWCILKDSFVHFRGECKCKKLRHLGVDKDGK